MLEGSMAIINNKNLLQIQAEKRILIETILVWIISFLFSIVTIGVVSALAQIVPIVYLCIEKYIRNRTWNEIGFKFRNTMSDIKDSWPWIITVVIVFQMLIVLIGKFLLPDFIVHVRERLPMIISPSTIISIIITLSIGTFLEEVIYRGFLQERLSWHIKPIFAMLITSIIFGFMHYSKGSPLIVSFDIFGIIIDSIVYGIIFNKTKNIFASWITHYLADVVGVILILALF
jgi:membrane protease YdiL (CAAX protease family)